MNGRQPRGPARSCAAELRQVRLWTAVVLAPRRRQVEPQAFLDAKRATPRLEERMPQERSAGPSQMAHSGNQSLGVLQQLALHPALTASFNMLRIKHLGTIHSSPKPPNLSTSSSFPSRLITAWGGRL
ncbi:hypothetical protein TREES_T100008706 [Tupaia chinensis]|uniref:Uncharacterized protein n=1 Tax=Tupaia chinensis TaxID=246437 RepID=L9L134_TUPCH|nr:hypothetical protein TREES_T100008706 [Tupaia chinensis]